MCGIVGIVNTNQKPVDPEVLRRASDTLRHRGPDDEGYFLLNTGSGKGIALCGKESMKPVKERMGDIRDFRNTGFNLGLGFRRLSILDLSVHGHQPMRYRDNWIVHNGEIFNFQELKNELKGLGYSFSTHTDTEVILASYAEWGEDCVRRFNGQWSFCLYDKKRGKLFCSRDRFGIVPFYYFSGSALFAFGSEIKALFSFPGVIREPDEKLLFDFVVFGQMDHTPGTMYKDIRQLPGGCNLIFDLKKRAFRIRRYFRLKYDPSSGGYDDRKARRYADDIRSLLTDSVRIRLRADVPVGSCLSGGLDSSSIVAIVSKLLKEEGISAESLGHRQRTFTAAYRKNRLDESPFAREVIKRTGVRAYFTYPGRKGLWNGLADLSYHQDEPFGSTSMYAQREVIRLASKHVRVLLDGQGGDEVFGGYPGYDAVFLAQYMKNGSLRTVLDHMKSRLTLHKDKNQIQALLKAAGYLLPGPVKSFFFTRSLDRSVFSFLFQKDYLNERYELIRDKYISHLNRRLFLDVTVYSLPQLLHYEDRNGMSFSLEARVPFLDHRLLEYAFGIPAVYKIHKGWRKWLLRLAMKDLLPESILWRRDKMGFLTPEKEWAEKKGNSLSRWMEERGRKRYTGYITWRCYMADQFLKGFHA